MPRTDAYRFTFGPWNISTGADPFGPPIRPELALAAKLKHFKELGFDGIQLHDDDVVPADWNASQTEAGVKELKHLLDDLGLLAEFVAPRLWEDARFADGAFTNNSKAIRKLAIERAKRSISIAHLLGTKNQVLWLAREGTYIREAKDPLAAMDWMLEAINELLAFDPTARLLGEMKPNEPMDSAYLPTVGHFLALIPKSSAPERVGVLIESAHSILAGIDPSEDMAYALWHKKLWSVHLNDQNGLKYDQDKSFGAVDLRRALNQVWVLERGGFGLNGECVGLDVKAMRTTRVEDQTKHLANSRAIFLHLVELVRSLDVQRIDQLRASSDYEALERMIIEKLMGKA